MSGTGALPVKAPALRLVRDAAEPRTIEDPRNLYLFSIDLEDIRKLVPHGERYADRVTPNTERYLEFLESWNQRCTFFTTGDVARRHPDLVARIVGCGHEIACHSSDHLPLDRHTRETFRDDLRRCREDFARAGAASCTGFRAPVGSLYEKTRWAYEVLGEEGFEYSASVLAAANPLYGWPEFGKDVPRRVDGLWEIPSSLSRLPGLDVPFAGGVYFRVLPFTLIRLLFALRSRRGLPVFGYLHPYDIDADQERFMHPEIGERQLYNFLLFFNRRRLLRRCERLMEAGYRMLRYDDYVRRYLETGLAPEADA